MSPAVTRAARLPHASTSIWPAASWTARLLAFLHLIGDVLREARDAQRAAHRRHPFTEW